MGAVYVAPAWQVFLYRLRNPRFFEMASDALLLIMRVRDPLRKE